MQNAISSMKSVLSSTYLAPQPARYQNRYPNKAVIMAGGLGTRLGELTKDIPKPMLRLGDKPVLEYIVRSFARLGFTDIYICLRYKSEIIRSYFGDGTDFGAHITYIEEKDRLGTGGALSLIVDAVEDPFFLMNGDLLTSINFESLLNFHQEREALATMCISEYAVQLPFGVVHAEDARVISIEEKPQRSFFVNAGIYVLDPALLDRIPYARHFDITSLFDSLLQEKIPVNSYIINEFWMDIGQQKDYERAQRLFTPTD